MQRTIPCESTVELPLISELERGGEVLEYYIQPSTFVLNYLSASGRNLRSSRAPDYLIRHTSDGSIEAIRQERLHTLSQEQPNLYRFENGFWVCPPGIAYAKGLGLKYTVHCLFGVAS
jgi:putative transposase